MLDKNPIYIQRIKGYEIEYFTDKGKYSYQITHNGKFVYFSTYYYKMESCIDKVIEHISKLCEK